jgi:putative ABC transport system substrate-binding protein
MIGREQSKPARIIALAIAGLMLAASGAVAQSPRVYRIGLLSPAAPLPDDSPFGAGLIRGLKQHGYAVGTNLVFERRGAQMRPERLPALVADLVASKVDVIVATGFPAAAAAKQGTTIPVVVIGAGDIIGTGLAASLARPGGNLTGVSELAAELSTKRLELLKEALPKVRRVAMLWNLGDNAMTHRYRAAAAAAEALGLVVQPLGVREAKDFEEAFAAMAREAPDGILVVSDTLTVANRKRVYDFASTQRLPVMYEYERYAREGGLMSYGPDQMAMAERAADQVARILKGIKPAEIPVEQPAKLRFVVNLGTAARLGLTLPQNLLARADEIIE